VTDGTVGVGPHPKPWPDDDRFDHQLLEHGDARNVLDKYRYWKVEAIKADLDSSRAPLQIAIENYQHDFNIGTIVRNANAFNVSAVHIIGKRHWNRRGAMVTDAYMHIFYHESVKNFIESVTNKHVIGVDIVPGAKDISKIDLPRETVLVFGAEGPGLSDEMQTACESIVKIDQSGSTRSINVGVASGIAMYEWTRRHIDK
jgi:tRNA G18 (ribose-2'-O)-methylase SpoU